jgi:hypothetical protein
MNLTEQQRTLYAAIGAGKEVRYIHTDDFAIESDFEKSHKYAGSENDPPLGHPHFFWRIIDSDTITVSYSIPKPLTVAPEVCTQYWLTTNGGASTALTWAGDPEDVRWLASGFCFKTRKDAEAAHTARTAAYRKALGV